MPDFTDDVRGSIIGGDFQSGRLYYDGRPQGPSLSADTTDDLIVRGNAAYQAIKEDYPNDFTFKLVFPKTEAWELRIFD